MTVCQAPALLGRPAGVRCARRRLGLRWRACRWAVSRLVLAGAWWPVAGQRPGLRLQQVTGAGRAATWAAVLAGGWAGPVTVSRAARTAGRSATSRAAGPVFLSVGCFGGQAGEPPERTAPGASNQREPAIKARPSPRADLREPRSALGTCGSVGQGVRVPPGAHLPAEPQPRPDRLGAEDKVCGSMRAAAAPGAGPAPA